MSRKRPRVASPARQRGQPQPLDRVAQHWKWRTFPVFFAFATGLLVAALLNTETDNTLEGVVQIVALLAFGYGIAHLVVRNIVVAGRMTKNPPSSPQDDDDWEDAVVHPDETPAAR